MELGEMLTKKSPYKYFCRTERDRIKPLPRRYVLHSEIFFSTNIILIVKQGKFLEIRNLGENCFHVKIWGKTARGNLQKENP